MFKLDRALPFFFDFTIIAHLNTRTIKGLKRREWFYGCSHMVGSSRINEEGRCWCAASFQCMSFPWVLLFFFFRVFLPCASRYRNVVLFQEKGHFIKLSSHTGAFWMEAPSTVRAEDLAFSILLYSLQTWRIIWILFLHRGLISLLPFIIFSLRSSCNQCLISGRLNDPHLDQFVMLLSKRFNERVKSRHLLVWSRELHRMKCWYKYWIVCTKFGENCN